MNGTEGDSGSKCKMSSKKSCPELDDLSELSKEALIERITRLQAQNTQLKNILQKQSEKKPEEEVIKGRKKEISYAKRHVLLKFYYLGWNYQGYVAQENSVNNIEYHLFHALKKCGLIEHRSSCNYQKCGRTDKGVSAFKQVVSLDLRSSVEEPSPDNCDQEFHYLTMINRLLPIDIRCYAWAHVASTIGARFDCTSRSYQYYFPKGDLDIKLMKEGAKRLIGEHDFRNLCKMDVANGKTNFVRNVTSAEIEPCSSSNSEDNGYSMYKFTVTANGFLWHQIRCIMAVLVLIGEGKESPDIITQLLDIETNPSKPQYMISDHTPLILFDNDYANADIKWNTNEFELAQILRFLKKEWTYCSVKEVMIREMMEELSKNLDKSKSSFDMEDLLIGKKTRVYKPLLSRNKCATLEDRIEHYVKKRKIVKVVENEETRYMSMKYSRQGSKETDELKTP